MVEFDACCLILKPTMVYEYKTKGRTHFFPRMNVKKTRRLPMSE